MATIELARLGDHLSEQDISTVLEALEGATDAAPDMNSSEDRHVIASGIDDDNFVDFRDKLEANDIDADIYVPLDFEELLEIGEWRVASSSALQTVLDSLRDDFQVEDTVGEEFEEDDEEDDFERDFEEQDPAASYYDDEDGGIEMKDDQLRSIWRSLYKAARESQVSNLPIFLQE